MKEKEEEKKLDATKSENIQDNVEKTELELAMEAMDMANSVTLEDIEEQEAEEAKANAKFVKIPIFTTKDYKTYELRLLPIKPREGEVVRDIAYKVHQALLTIKKPNGGLTYANITRPDYAGIDGDLGRYYRNRVLQIADENKDKGLKESLNHFQKGFKYKNQYILYVMDTEDRQDSDKTPKIQVYFPSFTQMKDIKNIQNSLWKELKADGITVPPFTYHKDAYKLKIIKGKTENGGTQYTFMSSARGNDTLSADEIKKWAEMPHIPEKYYVYTRYQHQALIEFLKQWDVENGLEITNEPEFIELAEKIDSQIPAEDTSSFSFDKNGTSADGEDEGDGNQAIQLDELYEDLDFIKDEDLDPKESDEAGELRQKIKQFITQEDLDIPMSNRSNETLIDLIVEALEEKAEAVRKANDSEKRRRTRK